MKKVACFFGGRKNFGGAERRIARILNEVCKRRSDVCVDFVLLLHDEYQEVVNAYENAIGSIEGNIKFIGLLNQKDVLIHMLKERYDVSLYTGPYREMLPFFVGAFITNSKKVLMQVNTFASEGIFDSRIGEIEFNLICRLSDQIDCLYPSTVKKIARKYKHTQVTQTPCPFTKLDIYQPSKKEKIISVVSRWVSGKNIDIIVDAIAEAKDVLRKYGYKCYLCGNGSYEIEESVRRTISNSGCDDLIVLPGYINSEDILPQSEVFISFQSINNYPSQSLLEAIACGCYIIASDQGDTNLIVRDSFGVLCHLNKKELAEEIIKYISKTFEEKDKSEKSARLFAESTFTIDSSAEHYEKVIFQ